MAGSHGSRGAGAGPGVPPELSAAGSAWAGAEPQSPFLSQGAGEGPSALPLTSPPPRWECPCDSAVGNAALPAPGAGDTDSAAVQHNGTMKTNHSWTGKTLPNISHLQSSHQSGQQVFWCSRTWMKPR